MRRAVGLAVAALALLVSGAAALVWAATARLIAPPALAPAPPQPAAPAVAARPRADSLIHVLAKSALFGPSDRAWKRSRDAAPTSAAPEPADLPPFRFRLLGVVLGRVPLALIEGLPGAPGPRLVRQGEYVGDLLVQRVTERRVDLVGIDTLWILRLKEPGQ